MSKFYFYTILLLVSLFYFASCSNNAENETTKNYPSNPSGLKDKDTEYRVKIIALSDSSYGYEILTGDKVFIKQPNIPAVNGIQTFINEEQAKITAFFTIGKLKKGIMPPTLSINELDSLKISYKKH